ncbi:PEBP1.2 family protein [Megaselia abdita]
MKLLVVLSCLLVVLSNGVSASSDVAAFMKHLEVIPDVIDEGPKDFLTVTYDKIFKADKGVELSPTQVKNQPVVEWEEADPSEYYTLLMTDPDAPSRAEPKFREWHHWLVGNIPGNNVSKGDVLSAYVGAGPPKGTGLHRYVLLVFRQSKKLDFDEPRLTNTSGEGREKFNTRKFIEKYGLGAPIAGNFFQAQYDDYVPTLYKQLSGK